MSVFYPGQSVRISDLVSVALVLRVRSIEGNVLELEACDGSFYGFRHASSVAPECTPPAETSVPPLGAGLVAQPSVGGGECARQFDFWVRRMERYRACAAAREARFVGTYSPYGSSRGVHGPAIHSYSSRARAFNASRSIPGVLFLECAA